MANNDPIKEYNEVNLKLERLKEKMEMYVADDHSGITDLHDCSNDLSDAGSRIEEYEHAKYAERVRQAGKKSNDVWANKKVNTKNQTSKSSSNAVSVIVVIIFILFYVFGAIAQVISEFVESMGTSLEEIGSYLSEDYSSYEDDEVSDSEFAIYKENIEIGTVQVQEDTYIEIHNNNSKSYENLKVETVFYDDAGEIISISTTYINILLGNNYHYFRVLDVPEKYDTCKHNVVNSYGNYSDLSKSNFVTQLIEKSQMGEDGIKLTSFNDETLDYVEVLIIRSNPQGEVSFDTYHFFDVEWGVEQEKEFYYYVEEDSDRKIILTTINDVY